MNFMAIEKNGMTAPMMPEGDMPEEVTEETAIIPSTMLGGQTVAPGDVVKLEVVSVDENTGDVTAKYAAEPEMAETGGIDEMAAAFE